VKRVILSAAMVIQLKIALLAALLVGVECAAVVRRPHKAHKTIQKSAMFEKTSPAPSPAPETKSEKIDGEDTNIVFEACTCETPGTGCEKPGKFSALFPLTDGKPNIDPKDAADPLKNLCKLGEKDRIPFVKLEINKDACSVKLNRMPADGAGAPAYALAVTEEYTKVELTDDKLGSFVDTFIPFKFTAAATKPINHGDTLTICPLVVETPKPEPKPEPSPAETKSTLADLESDEESQASNDDTPKVDLYASCCPDGSFVVFTRGLRGINAELEEQNDDSFHEHDGELCQ
jgi:hypothetical protein